MINTESSSITRELMRDIQEKLLLDKHSIHGPDHWSRVRKNGLLLCPHTGADTIVVELFAVIHDSQRWNDGRDLEHGPRAAAYARRVYKELFDCTVRQLELLVQACMGHTTGLHSPDSTVQTCWDADRLDIGRCGFDVDPRFLGTQAARSGHMITYAMSASRGKPDRTLHQIKRDLAEDVALTKRRA
ncbi:MAG TPA: hypothetical protein VJ654_11270 [Noviherbaspirillum sp.]|nr:hypothetical protein [Noviherbaspirillum sp.]